jgi:hypothetical protein
MSVRGAQGEVGAAGSADAGERRQGGGRRIHFEALVAIGESGGEGFEAESMDVSPDGMRLRTAYLPELGERLVCRFEAEGGEVVVEGEVAWVNAEARGGEFGLKFDGLDDASAAGLRAMCAPPAAPKGASEAEPGAARGTRVRLHIEGLASPMKARVRDAAAGEIQVGSNLEFLKVGRTIELEDVDHGARREAFVDHVKVEIDPASSVPQLVVALRYEGKRAAAPAAAAPAPKTERTPGPAVIDARAARKPAADAELDDDPSAPEEAQMDAGSGSTSEAEPSAPPRPATERKRAAAPAATAESDEADGERFLGTGAKAARAGMAMANKIVPALSAAGAKAKTAMSGLLATVQKRRAERADAKKAAAPKRTTAPAPNGALKTDGRRLVRDDGSDDDDALPPAPKPRVNRKAAVIGGALGLVAVLGVLGATRGAHSHAAAAGAASADVPAATASVLAALAPPAEPPPGGAMTAQVPLFGATPMSTTETVPVAPSPSGQAAAPGMPTQPDPVAAAAPPPGEDEPGAPDDATPGNAAGVKEWGHGAMKGKPVVLKLKLDGPVDGLNGASGAMGFTISLPGRRALSSASELARKDKRIASINVVNSAHGADVSVQFKDGVPPYLAKVKGDHLEIALGSEHEHKKVASKPGHKGDDKHAKKSKKKSKK